MIRPAPPLTLDGLRVLQFLRSRPGGPGIAPGMSAPELACKLWPGKVGSLEQIQPVLADLAGRRLIYRHARTGAWVLGEDGRREVGWGYG